MKLSGRDHPLRLVADVEQDLVTVDSDDFAVDDVAFLERNYRRCVVWNDPAVDLHQETIGTFDRNPLWGV